MKKLVLMIAMVVGVTAFAQERKMDKKGMSVDTKVEKMTKELDLTPEQQAKVKAIYAKKAETKKAERADLMTAKKTEYDAFDKELKAVLTPEQTKKLEAKRENQKAEKSKMKKGDRKLKKEKE